MPHQMVLKGIDRCLVRSLTSSFKDDVGHVGLDSLERDKSSSAIR